MRRQLPNALTLLRLLLAGLFFCILNFYRFPLVHRWALICAGVIFIVAVITDALDGYLARRWQVESTFGRIMDPFCDKVLVLGAFIYLSGPRFVIPEAAARGDFFNMASGVYPWMVALILARELLVTGIRGEMEGRGVKFGAQVWGKWKMILQSLVVPVVLAIVWLNPTQPGHEWLSHVRDGLVYLTVLVTVVSGLPYVMAGKRAMRG